MQVSRKPACRQWAVSRLPRTVGYCPDVSLLKTRSESGQKSWLNRWTSASGGNGGSMAFSRLTVIHASIILPDNTMRNYLQYIQVIWEHLWLQNSCIYSHWERGRNSVHIFWCLHVAPSRNVYSSDTIKLNTIINYSVIFCITDITLIAWQIHKIFKIWNTYIVLSVS